MASRASPNTRAHVGNQVDELYNIDVNEILDEMLNQLDPNQSFDDVLGQLDAAPEPTTTSGFADFDFGTPDLCNMFDFDQAHTTFADLPQRRLELVATSAFVNFDFDSPNLGNFFDQPEADLRKRQPDTNNDRDVIDLTNDDEDEVDVSERLSALTLLANNSFPDFPALARQRNRTPMLNALIAPDQYSNLLFRSGAQPTHRRLHRRFRLCRQPHHRLIHPQLRSRSPSHLSHHRRVRRNNLRPTPAYSRRSAHIWSLVSEHLLHRETPAHQIICQFHVRGTHYRHISVVKVEYSHFLFPANLLYND
jgi:hypothetical protein